MVTQPLVLGVDADLSVQRLLKLELEEQGFRVMTASTAEEALEIVREHHPELVVLEVNLPDQPGLELLAEIREPTNTPVIVLTDEAATNDRVRGLDLGADDYVPKPFSPEELGARIRAVLRRDTGAADAAERVVESGPLSVDLERRVVERGGAAVALTRTEWRLLEYLAEHADHVLLGPQILSNVWGPEYIGERQYLRVWISRLRKKLGSEVIRTYPGIGYMFTTSPDPPAAAE